MATPIPSKTPVPSQAPAPRPLAVAPPKPASITLAKPASRLGRLKRERLRNALRYFFYGTEGVGKTTLAADAGSVFLDIEGGSGEVVVARYSFNPDEPDEFKPRSYEQVLAAIDDLVANARTNGIDSIAIDTVDALEGLMHRYLCEQQKVTGIEKIGGGFGKGYRYALEEVRRFLRLLDELRLRQNVQVILLGHSDVGNFKNPEGEDYDRYKMSGHKDYVATIKGWCDVVGFVQFEGGSSRLKEGESREKRARGWTTNRRLMHLAREAAWDAKSRLALPSVFELDPAHPWQPFAQAAAQARNVDASSLTLEIGAELDRIGVEEFTTAAGTKTSRQAVLAMTKTADAPTLQRVLVGLRGTVSPLTSSQQEP
ncbi:MAG: ATP-binding protein [Deltaproteobacteria bacterium]|nr:ATP-binding protein [Deltaproteobacteria bacterium]